MRYIKTKFAGERERERERGREQRERERALENEESTGEHWRAVDAERVVS